MIQRIQTLFLLIVSALLGILIASPFATVIKESSQLIFTLRVFEVVAPVGQRVELSLLPVVILTLLCISISIITILLFRKRMLQIRLCVANTILLLGLQGLLYYYSRVAVSIIEGSTSFHLTFIFPLVCAILTFLALRAVARDEALVRSSDRLRHK